MNEEELKKLCDAWIEAEAAPDPEGDGLDAVAELKNAGFRLEHAGRYSLEMRPDGFRPEDFGKSRPDADGVRRGVLWQTFASPDSNYYFGDLRFESAPAHAAALLGQALRGSGPLDGASSAFALVFAAIRKRDTEALKNALAAGGISSGSAPGEMVMDDVPGMIASLAVFPL